MRSRLLVPLAIAGLLFAGAPRAAAQTINYSVSVLDPGGANAALYGPATDHLLAAGARWNTFLRPAATINVDIRLEFTTAVPLSTGRSTTSSFVGTQGGRDVFEQGLGAMIRTGTDPNGATHDVEIRLNPNYATNGLFFDPNPTQRTAPVPNDRVDAVSVMLHELGHAYGFNGFGNHTTGEPPPTFMSTWDRHVTFDGNTILFNGPAATYLYNRPVPITGGNNFHLGNAAPGAGSDLIPDLMNGVVFTFGTRYDVSPLDVAILSDAGLPTTPIPEPTGLLVVAAGAAAVGFQLRSRRHHASNRNPTPNAASIPHACHTTSA